jgi:arylsulfatase A-like enzyme
MPARHYPNVLIVSFDALRRDFISLYSDNSFELPLFDRAAGLGVVFTQAIANANWTVPSHASLFTGLESHLHRIFDWGQHLSEDTSTIFARARELGYQTAFFGSEGVIPIVASRPGDFDIIGLERDARIDLIHQSNQKPWLVFWHFLDTHAPYNMIPSQPANPKLIDFDLGKPEFNYIRELINTDRVDEIHTAIRNNLIIAGAAVEKLWDRLGENSIVVLLSDHGEDWRPYHSFHCSFEVPVLRIPMVVSAPGLDALTKDCLISHADVPALIWLLASINESERLDRINTWRSQSDILGRVIVGGPDEFNNRETYFAACDKSRMIIVEPSSGKQQHFYIDEKLRHRAHSWKEQMWIHLDQELMKVLKRTYERVDPPVFSENDTEKLLKHLEKLGYI